MRCTLAAALAALGALAALQAAAPPAPPAPPAACDSRDSALYCRSAGLRALPPLPPTLLVLDVSHNNITELPRDALQAVAGLRDLNLSANRLQEVGAGALGGAALARLWLDGCALRELPAVALQPLHRLHYLSAEDNLISEVQARALGALGALRTLRLARNLLRAVPAAALAPLARLQALSLAGNLISELDDSSLPALPSLHTLVLKRNRIAHISARAFAGTPALRVLRLEENLLTEVPTAFQLLPLLEELSVASNRVEEVSRGALAGCRRLARLELRANPLSRLHPLALTHLPHLATLVVSEARGLRALPALNGSLRLRSLRAEHARLAALPADLCASAPQLRSLDVKHNYLEEMPDLRECGELRVLDVSWNAVRALEGAALRGLRRLHDLLLAGNRLRRLSADAFRHTPDLQVLNLEDNQIEHIDMETFVPISKLEDLNVGNNLFPALPAAGLQRLLHLKAHNNPRLRSFHPPELFPRIQLVADAGAVVRVPLLRIHAAVAGRRRRRAAARRRRRGRGAHRLRDPAGRARRPLRLGQRHRHLGSPEPLRVDGQPAAGAGGGVARGRRGRRAARGALAPRALPAAAGAVPAVRGPVRLVDAALRRVVRVPAGAARQRHGGVRAGVLAQPHGRAALPGDQPGGGRLLHGRVPGPAGGGGRGHAGRVPRARGGVADVARVPAGRLPGRAVVGAVGVHAGGDHAGAQLRHHARHAPQQAAVAAARRLRDGGGLGAGAGGGRAAAAGRVRLPQVRGVPALRDGLAGRAWLRGGAAGGQRARLPRAARLLPQDVLRHPRLAGLEQQRLAHRAPHGAAGLHGLPVLVARGVLRADGGGGRAPRLARAGQGVHGVRAAAQLVLQPLPLRDPHQAVQEGLRARLQGHRGVARHARHRPLSPLLQLQQPPDAGQHQLAERALVGAAARRHVRVPAPAAGRRAGRRRAGAARAPGALAARVRAARRARARARAAPGRRRAAPRRLRLLLGGVQLVAVGLVARVPRRAAAAAAPRRLLAHRAQDLAGLEPVLVAQRLVRLQRDRLHGHVAHVALGRQRGGGGGRGRAAAAHAAAGAVRGGAAGVAGRGRGAGAGGARAAHDPVGRGAGAAAGGAGAALGAPPSLTPLRSIRPVETSLRVGTHSLGYCLSIKYPWRRSVVVV